MRSKLLRARGVTDYGTLVPRVSAVNRRVRLFGVVFDFDGRRLGRRRGVVDVALGCADLRGIADDDALGGVLVELRQRCLFDRRSLVAGERTGVSVNKR